MPKRRPSRSRHQRRLRFQDRRLTMGRLFYFVLDKGAPLIVALALYLVVELQIRR